MATIRTLKIVVIAGLSGCLRAAANDTMPPAAQNALVQKFCAVCHDDAKMIGGLSLQHFDAARVDPTLAAMLASKLKDGALGAAGVKPLPDRATQDAFFEALTEEAAGAREWVVARDASVFTANVVRQASPGGPKANLYRLKLTCDSGTRTGEAQLTWAPGDVEMTGATLSVTADRGTPLKYDVANGRGAAVIGISLPARELTVTGLIPGESTSFDFESLPPPARQTLSACFPGK